MTDDTALPVPESCVILPSCRADTVGQAAGILTASA
jgi:hypothetical protein